MEITKAFNGEEALRIYSNAEAYTFDVILMDILMPVMNGYNATKLIRASDKEDSKEIPIIAMTANAYDRDRKKALDAGMTDHVIKPIKIEKLYDKLLMYKK
jgi:CheY-like chemotaxis protein